MAAKEAKLPPDPVVNAMLLCDHAHQDPATGKHFLMGVFDRVNPTQFPAVMPPFGIYVNLRGLNGTYSVGFKFLAGDTEEEVANMEGQGQMKVDDPLKRVEMSFNLPAGVPLPKPGTYVLRLFTNGRYVHDMAIMAVAQGTQ